MPQINRGFQLSKMNKDFDERIVKDGEYRDALNIQVQSSDEDNVGSAQSILGNILMSSGLIPDECRCVGSVTYEKEDKIYYLVAGPEYDVKTDDGLPFSWKDYIIEYDVATKTFKFVFVDIYRTHFLTSLDSQTNPNPRYLEVDDPSNPPISNVRFEMNVNGYSPGGSHIIKSDTTETTTVTDAGDILVNSNVGPKILIYSVETDFDDVPLHNVPAGTILQCTQERVLNFHPNNIITGINIIDGMLFWTDNYSEPKKVNIKRSISGTGGSTELPISITTLFNGDNHDWHTRLCISPDKHNGLRVLRRTTSRTYYAEEENITVIRKGPKTPPRLVMSQHEDGRLDVNGDPTDTFSPTTTGILGNPDNLANPNDQNCFTKIEVQALNTFRIPKVTGDKIGDVYLDNPVFWKEGDIILFNQQQDINSAEGFTEHDVRAMVIGPIPCGGVMPCAGPWHMEIQSIDGDSIDEEQKMWNLRLEEKKPMFEFKFVRFAYRYKYEDGEYSTFSPWSELAFLPGEYDYLPKKGYNLGMTNRLRQLKITNYIVEPSERPKDVIEVDLLYKDEASPNIYTVETIKRTDGWTVKGELLWPDLLNGPNVLANSSSRGEYEVTSELIHKAVPSNQMLRPWDNVPRKALAQSISANRLVYGNYVQNFNLTSSLSCGDEFEVEIKPEINVSLRAVDAPLNAPAGTSNEPLNGLDTTTGFALPGKTARSLRTYQVGVVYGDEYGRETPVLAGHNGTGSLTIPKDNSSTLNKLHVDIATPAPDFAHYYKLYIKETSNEYYNLAMDRWYNAEDGNVWLSFASADRNKVDDETTLVLKKKHDSHEPVIDKARYKILAIENQAPDFIKTNIKNLGSLTNNAGGTAIGTTATGFPAPDGDKLWFTTGITGLSDIFDSANVAEAQLTAMRNRGTLYFRVRTDTIKSDWYQVAGYTRSSGRHKFKSDKAFGDDMDFTSIGGDISTVVTGLKIELAEHTIENKKEFEGRFFVKIYKDLVLQNEILSSIVPEYRVRVGMPIGYWNIPKMGAPNVIGISSNVMDWESAGLNVKREFDSNTNAVPDWCVDDPNGNGVGGNDRELWFYGANGSPIQGNYLSIGCGSDNGAVQGNVRDWMVASSGRFHIDNMWVRYRRCDDCAGLTCCSTNLFQGPEDDDANMGRGIHDGSGNPTMNGTSMDIGYITNRQSVGIDIYPWQDEGDKVFYDLMISPGTRFRWREDPDETVYVVTGSINANSDCNSRHGQMHTWHDDSDEPGNNKFRFQVDFQREDGSPDGFAPNNTASQYNPIGGKEITKVANREEMGYWGGRQSDTSTIYAGNNGSYTNSGIPLPPDYDLSLYPNGIPSGDADFNSYTGTEVDAGGNLLTVTKREMGCRWRRHASKFHHIDILEPLEDDDADWSSENPAIWETEPKEDVGVDIYYEASPALPIRVDYKTNEMFAPYGSKIVNMFGKHVGTDPTAIAFPDNNFVVAWSANSVQFLFPIDVGTTTGSRIGFERPDGLVTYAIVNQSVGGIDPNTGLPLPASDTNFLVPSNYFTIRYSENWCPDPINNLYSNGPHNQPVDLGWYNAFAYGNGIESDRIRDDYNQVTIANGVKASSVIATQYEEERRQTGLIHSGIYNSTSGVNDLNQFIAAEKITKDMNPEYGSIQKLHTRTGDIVVMHEDKIMKVLANKDALFNADGKSNVAISSNFLGTDWAFATKYGISTNPESFAVDLHGRIYFTDRARSAVLRLSGDGITNISNYGMKDWFNDHLNPYTGIAIGSYDAKKNLYNLSIEGYIAPKVSDESTTDDDVFDPPGSGCGCYNPNGDDGFDGSDDGGDNVIQISDIEEPNLPGYEFFQKTLSFSEQAKGWVSFKSFFPENGISINNEYYTWRYGHMYQHHANNTRNYFYGQQYKSTIDILFNDAPEIVKSFTTLNYEGSLARITQHLQPAHPVLGGAWDDNEYFNLTSKDGWYIESSTTNLQSSGELEFKNKEDKYFTYMKGVSTTLANLDEQEFSVQGIGVLGNVDWGDPGDPEPDEPVVELNDYCLEISPVPYCDEILGCMDVNALNYNPAATIDDGSCQYPEVPGCTDPTAANYDPTATIDDGNCCYRPGCMDDTMGMNPDINGMCRDGSGPIIPWTANWCGGNNGWFVTNFDPIACFNEGCELPMGCTNPNASNYDPFAVIDDGSCILCTVYGCTDSTASNYDPTADCDDGSCLYSCDYDNYTDLIISDPSSPGANDGIFVMNIPPTTPPLGNPWSGQFYLFDSSGNTVLNIPAIPNGSCTIGLGCTGFNSNITNFFTAVGDPSQAACGDATQLCYELKWGGTQWHLYVQGLPADTYLIQLINNTGGANCVFQGEVTFTEPQPVQLGCLGNNFPTPSTVQHYEQPGTTFDAAIPPPGTYGYLYGANHDYDPINNEECAKLLGSSPTLGYNQTDLMSTGDLVQSSNLDLYTMQYWQIRIACVGYGCSKIPWSLAASINENTILDGNIPGDNLFNNWNQSSGFGSTETSDPSFAANFNTPTITHTAGMYQLPGCSGALDYWWSEKFYDWATFLSVLNNLKQPGNPYSPLFPHVFDYTQHDFFYVRDYITRWAGTDAAGVHGLIYAATIKCTCDPNASGIDSDGTPIIYGCNV